MRSEPLATLDYVFASEAYNPTQLIMRFAAELDLERLSASFLATAREFVGVHAALARMDERTLAFDLSNETAELSIVEATPDTPLHTCGVTIRTAIGEPLSRAQVTRLGRGGTAIAFALSHAVADGYGYFMFLSAWAARARGAAFPAPTCDRRALSSQRSGRPFEGGKLMHAGFVLEDAARPSLRMEERWIDPAELKRSLSASAEDGALSDHDAISATLWKEFMGHSELAESTFTCPVDVRRHRPNLGPLFFGNASLVASVTVSTESLRKAGVREVAGWIRAAVSRVPGQIDEGLGEIEDVRSSRGLDELPRFRSVPSRGGFFVTNLSRIPLAVLDFGGGPPVALEVAPEPAPRDCGCAVLQAGDKLRLLIAH
jgi:hypothetical protein